MNQLPDPGAFQALINDLAELQATRYSRANPAPAPKPRPMAKAAPVAAPAPTKPVDFDRLAADQAQLEKAMRTTHTLHVQEKIRGHIAALRRAAKAGQLDSLSAARLDILIARAGALGLQP
jgi:hypothetical protein